MPKDEAELFRKIIIDTSEKSLKEHIQEYYIRIRFEKESMGRLSGLVGEVKKILEEKWIDFNEKEKETVNRVLERIEWLVEKTASSSAVKKDDSDLGLCLTPDSLITLANGTQKPLIELKPFADLSGRLDGDMVLSLNEGTGRLEPHRVLALLDMGVKPVYRITTQSGKSLKTTLTHPYLTKDGWRKLSQIKVGEKVAVTGKDLSGGLFFEESKQGSHNRPELTHNKNEHPADNLGLGLGNFSFQLSNPFFKTFFGNFQYSLLGPFFNFVKDLNKGLCPFITKFISQDFRYSNYCHLFSFLNLERTYHMLMALSRVFSPLAYAESYKPEVSWDKVVSIEPLGSMPVYDIEVEGTHNFVAEGIVAHNTYQSQVTGRRSQEVSSALEKKKGGIDLNPQNLEMEIKGAGMSPVFMNNISLDLQNFQGFTFQILSIQQVKDWEGALG